MIKFVNIDKIKQLDNRVKLCIGISTITVILISGYVLYKLNTTTPINSRKTVEIYFNNKQVLNDYEDMVVVYNEKGQIMDAVLSTTEYNPAEIYIDDSQCFAKSDYLNLVEILPNISKNQKIVIIVDYQKQTLNVYVQNKGKTLYR